MKRFIYLAAVASIALVGCAKNEAVAPQSGTSDQLITFSSPVVGVPTKGTPTVQYPSTGKFHVVGKIHEGNYGGNWDTYDTFMNTAVELLTVDVNGTSTKSWFPTDGLGTPQKYFWPKDITPAPKITFIAYSPNSLNIPLTSITDTGITYEDYTVATAANIDFLYSHRTYNKTSSTNGTGNIGEYDYATGDPTYDGVNILFEHALSAVAFTVKTKYDYGTSAEIKLNSITLKQIYSQADFSQGIIDVNVSNEGVKVQHNPSWTNYDLKVDTYTPCSSPISLTDDTVKDAGLVYLIPQTLTDDMEVEVIYSIKNASNYTLTQKKTVRLNTLGSTQWERGKKYIYNIIITLDEIYFAPEVVKWDEVSTLYDINI